MPGSAPFYVAGGTLAGDAPSYVRRRADLELVESLARGEFCYVLTSRQMGKSSLMVRAASDLRRDGRVVAIVNLTEIGQNLSAEQSYGGLLGSIGQQLGLEEDLNAFWGVHSSVGPLARWMKAIRDVVLSRCSSSLVIFVDEIDVTRSLPFPADEFFAAVRECYNRRAEDRALDRLTFCLMGVASPSELIRDTRLTPFNIGRRIELHDFQDKEAALLASGLASAGDGGRRVLARVLHWTGGHPYLTQRLCQEVATNPRATTLSVDEACRGLFLSPRARERDDNLLFVRERLVHGGVDLAALLDLYERVRRGKRVHDDETSPLVGALQLAGIITVDGVRLRVRNRIYERVFDRAWVIATMPDAERRRQRAAFRRGMLRAAVVASVILTALSLLTVVALRERAHAIVQQAVNRQLLYAADMNLASQAWDRGDLAAVLERLDRQRPDAGQEDLRGFEWYHLWRLCHSERLSRLADDFAVMGLALSSDGRYLATAGWGGRSATLWHANTLSRIHTLQGHTEPVVSVAFSPDASLVATASADATVKLWDVGTGRARGTLAGHTERVSSVAFSPDGRVLASGSFDKSIKIWDVTTLKDTGTLSSHTARIWKVRFSPDGRTLVSASSDTARVFDVGHQRQIAVLRDPEGAEVTALAFSPDGQHLVTGARRNGHVWNLATGRTSLTLRGHGAAITEVAFSRDGRTLVSAGDDGTARLWDSGSGREIGRLKATVNRHVTAAAFSPDGALLFTGSDDGIVRAWDVGAEQEWMALRGHAGIVQSVAFSPDGTRLATAGNDGTARLWNARSGAPLATLGNHASGVWGARFSPDGNLVITLADDAKVRVWHVPTGKALATLAANRFAHPLILPDGQRLIAGDGPDRMRVWTVGTWQERAPIQGDADDGSAHIVALSPDGKTVVTTLDTGLIRLRDVETFRIVATLRGHTDMVGGVVFSKDGQVMASGSFDGTVRLWDVPRRQQLAVLRGHRSRAIAVAFSPDERRLATGGLDATIRIWDVGSRQELVTLRGHTAGITSVAFSPDGTVLASAGDETVRLWRAAKPSDVAPIQP